MYYENEGDKGDNGGEDEGEVMVGWVEEGVETQRGKLSLICLSRGIFGLPLAINLVTLLCSIRGTSHVGWACVCLSVRCVCDCTLTSWTPYRAKKSQETCIFLILSPHSRVTGRCLAEGKASFLFPLCACFDPDL